MHKDTIKGSVKEVAGSIKEATGKATGDERLQAEGVAEKMVGKVQKNVGDLKSAARDTLKS
ncbi:MAG TPA: CsbD family protein [Phenylobacterium sp.]|nr:CsbD family protein [Phenylobacterium sp.]